MVCWGMAIVDVITQVFGSSIPVETELDMAFESEMPVEAVVHNLHLLLDNGFVDNTGGSGVVSLYRLRRLCTSHFDKILTKRDHLIGGDEESAKFNLRCRGNDKFDDLRTSEDGTFEAREGIFIGEKDVCASSTASFRLSPLP